MKALTHMELKVVTTLGPDRRGVLEETSIDELLMVLCRRATRLVKDPEIRARLRPCLEEFVENVVEYFRESGDLDEYVLANIMTALATADSHGPGRHGVEDYSTFVRRLNPTDPDTFRFFVVGREGRVGDPGCPLSALADGSDQLAEVPAAQLHVYRAFHHARSRDATRGAPRIPVAGFATLLPFEVRRDPVLEEAFLDVCLSDGAWELYQRRLAA